MADLAIAVGLKEQGQTLELKPGESGTYVFDVLNNTGQGISLSTRCLGGRAGWASISVAQLDLPSQGHTEVTVTINVPANAPPGSDTFQLQVYKESDTQQASSSAAVVVNVPEPVVEPPPKGIWTKWWFWTAIAGGVAVVVVAIIIIFGSTLVPNVVGEPLDIATNLLEEAGLQVNELSEELTGEVDGGIILSQDPAAESEAPDDNNINLVMEAASVEVPVVIGRSATEARMMIEDASLAAGDISEGSSGNPDIAGGTVFAQDPAGGDRVLQGAAINLTVEKATVTVPGLVGQNVRLAAEMLQQANLLIGNIAENNVGGTPGMVLSHLPVAGAVVAPGSEVNLVVQSAQVTVPRLQNKTIAAARTQLADVGLKIRTEKKTEKTGATGRVISQRPAAGATARIGNTVTVVVRQRPNTGVIVRPQIMLDRLKVGRQMVIGGTLRTVPEGTPDEPPETTID